MELRPVLVCLFLSTSGPFVHGGNYKPSKNLYTFLHLLSGYFTNQEQVRFESQNPRLEPHVNNFTVMFRPVIVRKLHNKITFYLEVALDAKVLMRRILIVSEDFYGVIFFQVLKVLDNVPYKPCRPGDAHQTDYSDIRFEPNDRSECQIAFYAVEQNVFSGTLVDCHSVTEDEIPKYSMALTCRSASYVSCSDRFVGRPSLPTIALKVDSYALPYQFTRGAHFASPCR